MTRLLTAPSSPSSKLVLDDRDQSPIAWNSIEGLSSRVRSWFQIALAEGWTRWGLTGETTKLPVARNGAADKRRRPKRAPQIRPVSPEMDWPRLQGDAGGDALALAYAVADAILANRSIPLEVTKQFGEIASKSAALPPSDDPLRNQIECGEIPLILSALSIEDAGGDPWARQARRTLSRGVLDFCDGEGMVEAKHLPNFWQLLAAWTRCRSLARAIGGSCFDETAEPQLAAVLTSALRLLRGDGVGAFSTATPDQIRPLLLAALDEFGGADERRLAADILPAAWVRGQKLAPRKPAKAKRSPKSKKNGGAKPVYPAVGVFSDWAHFAQLRSAATRSATRLTVAYDGARLSTELESAMRVVWSGEIETRITFGGQRLAPTSDWEETCWLEEEEADYLELSLDFEQGVELQRQMLLVREAGVVFLGDVVLSPHSGKLQHEVAWPLSPGWKFRSADETREAFLHDGKRTVATLIPPAFPEWQVEPVCGGLSAAERSLRLQTTHTGQHLYAPLVIDLNPQRAKKEITWRQLTIAENRELVGADIAVGYRVRIGDRHWLFYRSLGAKGNRTVFGVNLITEFLAARIEKDGTATTLIEVE